MTGRLTLSWANKDKALLSHGETGYEWVERDDPRAREVRLLDEANPPIEPATPPIEPAAPPIEPAEIPVSIPTARPPDAEASSGTGGVGPSSTRDSASSTRGATDNLLIRGDSLDALRALVRIPEYAAQYRGKVKLVYIDPPFNTGQAFEHYDDSLEHSVWLGMMRERLVLIRELLAPDGSVWVHLDDAEMAYCRVLMDEVFGRQNFVATVVWEKVYSPRMDAKQFSSRHDGILVFARESGWLPNAIDIEADPTQFRHIAEDGRKYRSDPLRKWGKSSSRTDRPNMWFEVEAPSGEKIWPIRPDGTEGRWRWGKETFNLRKHELDWLDKGSGLQPYVRQYAEGSNSRPPETIWLSEDVGHNHEAQEHAKKIFGGSSFATPKPERLLERVIHIGSNPGDIVLDCFAGSGTTAAVAHKMGRRWVTVELSEPTVDTFTRPRMEKVVRGEDPGGITESAGWAGGGGFRDLRVAPSAFDVISDELGVAVYRSEDVTDEALGRSVAAQLGYELDTVTPGEPSVFVGTKGRSRLAVAPGVVDAITVADIVSALGPGETALIAGLAHTDDAETTLAELSPGSRLLRRPSELFPMLGRVTR